MMMITPLEYQSHNSSDSCWIIVNGRVLDVTKMLARHPGGSGVILKYAGKLKDCREEMERFHPSSEEFLNSFMGPEGKESYFKGVMSSTDLINTPASSKRRWLNVRECREEALAKLSPSTQAYFETGAEDETTLRRNEEAFLLPRYEFRPRMLRNVSVLDVSVRLRGFGNGEQDDPVFAAPLMMAPVAMQGLADPENAELSAMRAARRLSLAHCLPLLASTPWEACLGDDDEERGDNKVFIQVYLPKDREELKALFDRISKIERRLLGIMITVDSATLGKRERDVRGGGMTPRVGNESRWDDGLDFDSFEEKVLRRTRLPIIVKGISRGDDAVELVRRFGDKGMKGLVVSNHGGRNLDNSISSLEALEEVQGCLVASHLREKTVLFFDGGVRRGNHVMKALSLGAEMVMIGRPVLYGIAAGGETGAREVFELLIDELKTTMKLCGVSSLSSGGNENGLLRNRL